MDELPHRPIIDLQAPLRQLDNQPTQGKRRRSHPLDQPSAMVTGDLGGATLPVARSRSDHFTTLDGATLNAAATARTLSPAASRDIARVRKSIDKGLVISADLRTSTQIESENYRLVNPVPIQPSVIPRYSGLLPI